jgi:hypothetical protein
MHYSGLYPSVEDPPENLSCTVTVGGSLPDQLTVTVYSSQIGLPVVRQMRTVNIKYRQIPDAAGTKRISFDEMCNWIS